MKTSPLIAFLLASGVVVAACQSSSAPNQSRTIRFEPPSTDFVKQLNITPPVDAEEAKAIAAEAAGGTAVSVTEETEAGELIFEVIVDTPDGRMEVEVRASDGAVVEMEPDDGN